MSPTASDKVNKSSGYTLMEVIMSLFVLGVITLMFASTAPSASKMAYMNGQYAQAASLCQHKIDQMRAVGFGRLTYAELHPEIIDDSPSTPPYSFAVVDSVSEYLPDATAIVRVDQVPNQVHVLKVTATVTWKIARHQTHTSSMSVQALITD
ncbi:MAG: type II secretion system protein [Armatimonadetes bacterium]|nr:type II secretion system protein [Armatimonadota bacterium]